MSKVILICGMHRSGTSCITEYLSTNGYDVGSNLIPKIQEVNSRGFFEDREIVDINTLILSRLGFEWHSLGLINCRLIPITTEFIDLYDRARDYIKGLLSENRNLVLKDPRFSITISFWERVFNDINVDIRCVYMIRHPSSVIESLEKRDKFSSDKSALLWMIYNIKFIESIKSMNFIVVDYDNLLDSTKSTCNQIYRFTEGTDQSTAAIQSHNLSAIDHALRRNHNRGLSAKYKSDYNFSIAADLYKRFTRNSKNFRSDLLDHIKSITPALQNTIKYIEMVRVINEEHKKQLCDYHLAVVDRDSIFFEVYERIKLLAGISTPESSNIASIDIKYKAIEYLNDISEAITDCRDKYNFSINQNNNLQKLYLNNKEQLKKLLDANINLRSKYHVIKESFHREKSISEKYSDLKSEQHKLINHSVSIQRISDAAHARIAHLENQIKELELELSECIETKDLINRQLLDSKFELSSIKSSFCWKITFPYRIIGPTIQNVFICYQKIKTSVKTYGLYSTFRKVMGRLNASPVHQFDANIISNNQVIYLQNLLPSKNSYTKFTPRKNPVTVILPVYRGYDVTKKCIESVFNAKSSISYNIIIINDCSPDEEINNYLRKLSHKRLKVIHNKKNIGFVKSVNYGMKVVKGDVILLNSDTVVGDYWIERIIYHSYHSNNVATITPFSNNATICSYPVNRGVYPDNIGFDINVINDAFYKANKGRALEIPTGVGFCMFISRLAIESVGYFDEDSFGKGYGEENDFCIRAANSGWLNLLATDVYVTHVGEVSFQNDSDNGKRNAIKILSQRYPNYLANVSTHVSSGITDSLRIAATAQIFNINSKPNVLIVSHHYDGGTEKHIQEIIEGTKDTVNIIRLRPSITDTNYINLTLYVCGETITLPLLQDLNTENLLIKFFTGLNLNCIHVHHMLGIKLNLRRIVSKLHAPLYYTIHDYYTICPTINLLKDNEYCGEHSYSQCVQCMLKNSNLDILEWRSKFHWLFSEASRVICPSKDVLNRIKKYHPCSNALVVQHEKLTNQNINCIKNSTGSAIKVIIIGYLPIHKGANIVKELISIYRNSGENVHFRLIGTSNNNISADKYYSEYGEYDDVELSNIIQFESPDWILFPAVWPETYSYTLTAAIKSGFPICAPNIGAFTDRLESYTLKNIYNYNSIGKLARLLLQPIGLKFDRQNISITRVPNSKYYRALYKASKKRLITTKKVNLLPELHSGIFSPCSYIRLLIPYLLSLNDANFTVNIVNNQNIFDSNPSVIILNRTALDPANVEYFLSYARTNNIYIVYDIDDDLLNIKDCNHTDSDFYHQHISSIEKIITEADLVTVSTNELRNRYLKYNDNIVHVPNRVAKTLWSSREIFPKYEHGSNINVLYMGTETHEYDLQILISVIVELNKRKPYNPFKFYLIGVTGNKTYSNYFNYVTVPDKNSNSYPNFVEWLCSTNKFDIGVAPLQPNEFNNAKSPIKFIDYTMLGIPTIASEVPTYSSIISNSIDGYTAKSTDEWIDALINLSNREHRDYIVANAKSMILDRFIVEGSDQYYKNLKGLFDEKYH